MNTNNPPSNTQALENQENFPRPNAHVAKRVEELLQEQLYEMGIDVKKLNPEEIAKSMKCHIAPDNSMTYFWNNNALLDIIPETKNDSIVWRMFTKDDMQLTYDSDSGDSETNVTTATNAGTDNFE